MKLSFLQSIALAGLLGCCSGSRADGGADLRTGSRATLLPIRSAVVVKEVRGQVEYAYDSTGWKQLASGKTLRPGATVRASSGSEAILRVSDGSNYLKVSALTEVHFTTETPIEEMGSLSVAAVKAVRSTAAD